MAPEIIKNLPYDTKVDIWSLGILAYILFSGQPPFSGKSKQDIFIQLTSHPISYTDNSAWLKVSREAKSLVKKMLTRDPRIRPSAEELLAHEFFQDKMLIN